MAIVQAETASNYMSEKIKDLIESVRSAGEGPGKTPPIDARELAGYLGVYLNTLPTFQFGEFTVGAAAGGDDHVVKLGFKPKAVVVFIDSVTDALLVKIAPMGAGTPADQNAVRFLIAGASSLGSYISFRDETVPVAPATYDEKAFTVLNAALANNDVVSWLAIG